MMLDFFWPDLSARSNDREIMDDPRCDSAKLINTVRKFAFLNLLFSRSRYLIKRYILSDMLKDPGRTYTFLDLGAGACDIPLWLLKKSKKLKLSLELTCLDQDLRIVAYAERVCRPFKNIRIIHENAYNLRSLPKFDYIFSNHFMHHQEKGRLPELLKLIHCRTNRMFLMNDIRRSNLTYLGFTLFVLFAALLFRNDFHFHDGKLSIRKSYQYDEMVELMKKNNMPGTVIVGRLISSRIYIIGRPR